MKTTTLIIILIGLYLLTTSLQCERCNTGTIRLESKSRAWIPSKNVTFQNFRDNTNSLQTLALKVVDTTEQALNDCGDSFRYEYKQATLYLNTARTDSIYLSLASGSWLCASGRSDNTINFSVCNLLGQQKEGKVVKSLSNYTLGSRTYSQALIILNQPGNSDNIDSVVIAREFGIVGFRYFTRSFVLQ